MFNWFEVSTSVYHGCIRDGWKCKGYKEIEDGEGEETSTEFEDVDLTDKEWADYDEKSGESTCISEFEVKFVVIKEKWLQQIKSL